MCAIVPASKTPELLCVVAISRTPASAPVNGWKKGMASMSITRISRLSRRALVAGVAVALTAIQLAGSAQSTTTLTPRPMKIGFIGSGNIGGTIGELLAKAGHEVLFSSRNPDDLKALVARVGPRARAGTPNEAVAFGEVVFIGVPYSAMPQIGRDYARQLAGKIVLDAGNPSARRDGAMAEAALAKGAGVATAEYLPGARVVRAFNSINFKVFASEAHRAGEKLAVPLAGDDAEALAVASRLVTDAGFEPVVAGPLAAGKTFDSSSPLFLKALTARELREALKLPELRR
jgi:predicted dinucleotide-binding enzyme